ncbi:AI-2E family transporter [[Clostridium] aminophilum]|uniref:Predicted PurR-regulated permease PerM n=1 Tax=[Clostridium] aminophilum TaxID=1526 RepID=A0A1I6IRD1_9FIRM|nr:AI-2E family transporter [[Clostridium] aminophilum]SFR69283.1 Predicted PurR-regulated permease PerM [[Clostridium] aminophilum]
MEKKTFRDYLYLGITLVSVIAICILIGFGFQHWEGVADFLSKLVAVTSPFIYGAVLAYLVSPAYNRVQDGVCRLFGNREKKTGGRAVRTFSKMIATVVSLALVIVIVGSVVALILPQLIESIRKIYESLPQYWYNINDLIEQKLMNNPDLEQSVMTQLSNTYERFRIWGEDYLRGLDMSKITDLISQFSTGIIGILVEIKNWLIGLIVMVYLLNLKETLSAQAKKVIYSIFSTGTANAIIEEFRYIDRVFGGFIVGKILDSVIIGILCFLLMTIFSMPYPMLLSAIIGVTNVIPFFGPFIGAIPTAILVLLVSPIKCLWFLGLILLLQQFDGNILGPKILGDSTGLPSFWVMFAIIFFGGFFGFVGMIVGVPLFAVIANLIKRVVHHWLKNKGLPVETSKYIHLKKIDEETGGVVSKTKE